MSGRARTTIEESASTKPTASASAIACLDGRLTTDLAVSGGFVALKVIQLRTEVLGRAERRLPDAQSDQDTSSDHRCIRRSRGDERLRADRVAKLGAGGRDRRRAD